MKRGLALVGVVASAFGLAAYRVLGEPSTFITLNVGVGFAALLASAFLALRGFGRVRQPAMRGPLLRALSAAALACVAAAGVFALASASGIRFDWTFEGQFQLAEATQRALAALPARLEMTLYHDENDPRIRNTRILLGELARGHDVALDQRSIEQHPEDEDRYGIGSSNSVLLRQGERWRLVERPSEGALYEAISSLSSSREHVLYFSVGAGEGDLERSDDLGFSGLRAALESEGYEVRPLPLAVLAEIPPDAAGVVLIAPRRSLREPALAALVRYLDAGGRLVAFLEPGSESGLEEVLARYGLRSPDQIVIDPASGPVDDDPPGLSPIAFNYSQHAVTRGLDRNRMTFFRRARSFDLRKAQPDDRLMGVVLTSGEAWRVPSDQRFERGALPPRPPDARRDYFPLVATALIPREGGTARLLAFGDSDLASNRYLRALYNLDLVLNGIHWALERESAIGLRPKTGGRQLVQFPVPLQSSLSALYGVGLLVPELLLIAGGLVWLHQRRA